MCFRFGPYFVSPVIAGLDKIDDDHYEPVICTYDSIGTREDNKMFQTGGTAGEFLMGPCETYWKPDMNPEELFEVTAQTLLAGINRDSLAGWGAYVYVMTPTEITVFTRVTSDEKFC